MLKVGLLGAGRIAGVHATAITTNPGSTLVAVSDINAEAAAKLAAQYGAEARTTDAILNDPTIDAVMVLTPPDSHADFARMAVEAGKHVMVEKPLVRSTAEAHALAAAVRAAPKPVTFFALPFVETPDHLLVQTLLQKGKNPSSSKVLVMGITFKEDVADIRNSKVVDLVKELMSYSIHVQITDPWASPNEVAHEYKLSLTEQAGKNYDAIVLAVGHQEYKKLSMDYFKELSHGDLIFFDLKGLFQQQRNEADYYWTL